MKILFLALIGLIVVVALNNILNPQPAPNPAAPLAQPTEPLPDGVDLDALSAYCGSLALVTTRNRKLHQTPDQAIAFAITYLARQEGISLGRARAHMRYLARQFGSWEDVNNECIDRGLMIDLDHLKH